MKSLQEKLDRIYAAYDFWCYAMTPENLAKVLDAIYEEMPRTTPREQVEAAIIDPYTNPIDDTEKKAKRYKQTHEQTHTEDERVYTTQLNLPFQE